jgi:hypothetical protein
MRSYVNRFIIKFVILAAMLIGLPLAGVWLAGYPILRYIEFPPESRYVSHAPFAGVAFAAYSIFILAVSLPLIMTAIRAMRRAEAVVSVVRPFAWWGWLGAVCALLSWLLAWTRFDWFEAIQPHSFTPLWLSYIVVVNALNYRRSGSCMMTARPGYFLLLFPVSALFWWFFEYLNRFVQNWYYEGVRFSAREYFWYATLSFSTVLPAVLGTRDLILRTGWVQFGFKRFVTLNWRYPHLAAWITLLLSSAGLSAIGIWPDFLFPLLWISPLLIIVSLQALMQERHILTDIARGDWRPVMAGATAALICGWFWEMWNTHSLARWVYSIPFVHRFQLFEMPILGYAGYLPFGLECTVIGAMLERLRPSWTQACD